MLTAQENVAEGPVYEVSSKKENLEINLEETKDSIKVEGMSKLIYQHMLDRMKKDHIATKIKGAELESSLRSK